MITITLTEDEERLAVEGGQKRQDRAKRDGRKDTHGFKGDPLATHIHGVACEIAVYKALGLTWKDTPYDPDERDLPNNLEIRGRTKHSYDLLIWPTDKVDRAYIHVTKETGDPEYRIHGLMAAGEAMSKYDLRQVTERPPSYFVPPIDLFPFEDLLSAFGDFLSTFIDP